MYLCVFVSATIYTPQQFRIAIRGLRGPRIETFAIKLLCRRLNSGPAFGALSSTIDPPTHGIGERARTVRKTGDCAGLASSSRGKPSVRRTPGVGWQSRPYSEKFR